MLSIVLSGGGLLCLTTSEVTPAVYSSRSQVTFRCFVPCATTDVALTREFPYVLVLLLLLSPTLWSLLALALWLLWAEARLLRFCCRVVVAPRLPSVARWITTSWIGRVSNCSMLLRGVHIVIHLSPLSCLMHGSWVVDEDLISCPGLETRDIMV